MKGIWNLLCILTVLVLMETGGHSPHDRVTTSIIVSRHNASCSPFVLGSHPVLIYIVNKILNLRHKITKYIPQNIQLHITYEAYP